SIINMSSVVGGHGNAGQVNYAASKAGMVGMAKSIAKELGTRNIRANCVAPGFIDIHMTQQLSEEAHREWMEMIPMHRAGQVSEIANACLFLASDLASYVTGQVIYVDGGLAM
ncbi:MAG: SDR family oxidoreductase, partial [Bacteroidales bacterium]